MKDDAKKLGENLNGKCTYQPQKVKDDLIAELDKRISDKIIEQTNADLLKKLIQQAETINEAIMIAELGTTYKRTGFHFDKRLEKMTDTIKYFKKNEKLSFATNNDVLTHKLIIGDNYDALLNLLIEYRGRIDVIYIDPPYGKDSMGDFAQTNYDNAITRDNLLSMLYPRLMLARQLLSENGVIFCSIDDKNHAYVKGLFDEVFGESNFAVVFPWQKRTAKSDVPFGISQVYEWVLCYANKDFMAGEEHSRKYYRTDDYEDRWRTSDLKKQTTAQERPNSYFTMIDPKTKKQYPASENRTWMITKDTFDEYYAKGKIVFPDDYDFLNIKEPVYRVFESEDKEKALKKFGIENYKTISTILDPKVVGMTQEGTKELDLIFGDKRFPFSKPVALIKRLLKVSSNETSTILDFFAGSGTTGQAVLELNKQDGGKRQFILATANEITDTTPNGIVNDVTSKRLKRVMTGECYDGTKDFKWNEKNEPLGDNLDVYDIATVANFESAKDKTPFDVIDETLYGKERLGVNEKIKWVCENFEGTQKKLEDK